MIRVRIPPTLRTEVGGAREVEASGSTLGEVLEDVSRRFPALGRQVLEDERDLAPFVNVYVDNEDARTLQGLATPVREGSTVILLPAMAGGDLAPLVGVGFRRADTRPRSYTLRRRWRRSRATRSVASRVTERGGVLAALGRASFHCPARRSLGSLASDAPGARGG